jgi:predicted signal transduction protein with EAL and GGDEF domain
VQIGLDDFGTGYASLTHLRRLPLTFVKIDQSFVQGLETDHEDDQIVSAVVDLAANLGLRSIAEVSRPMASYSGCGSPAVTRPRAISSLGRCPPSLSCRPWV